ncbi:MAG: alpha/beta hydrolase-fold protein [Chitinophagaceae bacterium]
MKYLIFIAFFTPLTSGAIAQSQADFTLGFADSLQSTLLNEKRQLLVYTPYSGKQVKPFRNETYPVLYVLDGENYFRSVAAIVERMVSSGVCPPMIVVGIPNTNRGRDLTPKASPANGDGIHDSGGGEKFISFIEKELMPYIESSYPVAPYKLLMGHSLGGLMVMQTLVHHKDLFNAYISIDAAIWWDDHKILKESKSVFAKDNYENKTLFLTIANRMERSVDTTTVQSDTSDNTELIRYNLELIHYIKQHSQNKLRFNHAYYENESHGTVAFISAYDALRFIFNYYEFPRYTDYTAQNPRLMALITEHYSNISKQIGYKILPSASLINSFGYRALHEKQFEMAKQLFEINVLNYPQDANLQDSFGDYYNAVGDKKNAIAWYRKALTVSEIRETKEKLDLLLKEK